jgi:hypothetical protein
MWSTSVCWLSPAPAASYNLWHEERVCFILYISRQSCIDIIIIVGRTYATHRAICPVGLLVCLRHTLWVHGCRQESQDRLEERTHTDLCLCSRIQLTIRSGSHEWPWTKRLWLPWAKPLQLHLSDQPNLRSEAISFPPCKARRQDRNQCLGQQLFRLYSEQHHICSLPVYHLLLLAHLRLDPQIGFHQTSQWMRTGAPQVRWEGVWQAMPTVLLSCAISQFRLVLPVVRVCEGLTNRWALWYCDRLMVIKQGFWQRARY